MKKGRPIAAALLIATSLAAAPAASGAPQTPLNLTLSGSTKDDLGHVLEGVEVLILANEPAGGTLGQVVSDAQGRFMMAALQPGIYRIAAIKSGYLASLSRVNTSIRASVDLVLHPVPAEGTPGAERVAPDLAWTLRLPPRSILHEIGAKATMEEKAEGGVRTFAARVQDMLTGEVDHVVALGSWRSGPSSASSPLEGAETHMRLAGNLGSRGAISVQGRRGNLDAGRQSASPSISRDAADLGFNVSYDTGVDQSLAMSGYYASGDLAVGNALGLVDGGGTQGQRSWGYDARWRKQVDASSQVAVLVGFRDASLAVTGPPLDSDSVGGHDASNRAIAAEGFYEGTSGDRHLLRFGVRAQRLDLSSPDTRFGRPSGTTLVDGTSGWSVLLDAEDRWSPNGPVVLAFGLAVRQGFEGSMSTTMTPRVAATWATRSLKARGELSYLAAANLSSEGASRPWPSASAPLGYDFGVEAPITPTVRWLASASYVPLVADRWSSDRIAGIDVYVTDGLASDRVFAVGLERTAASATVSFRVSRGRAEGALAPSVDDGLPFLILEDQVIAYDAVRIGTQSSRAGSMFAVEYRALREQPVEGRADVAGEGAGFKTVSLEFAQDLVRLGGGRATCRFLLAARTAFDSEVGATIAEGQAEQLRRFAALQQRVSAGVSLAF